jgi:hypothetical protein
LPIKKTAAADRRLTRVTAICLGLPETLCERKGDHASFLVRKKVFAYYLANHHNDGIISICAKVFAGDNKSLTAGDPARFYLPAYIGPRGWVGLRLDVGKIDWDEVAELVTGSYLLTAPKTLASQVKITE